MLNKLMNIDCDYISLFSHVFTPECIPSEPCYSKCGLQKSSIGITWNLMRNGESQAPPQTYCINKFPT